MADPHGAVDGAAADGRTADGEDVSRLAFAPPGWRQGWPCVMQVNRPAENPVADARAAVAATDLAQHKFRRVAPPVDGAIRLRHRPDACVPRGNALRLKSALAETLKRLHDTGDSRLRHLVAIEARFRRRAHGKLAARPHRPGVHLRFRLKDGHAPARRVLEDRPIQRRRPAIAPDAWMDDETGQSTPHRLRNRPLQERRDDAHPARTAAPPLR